LGVNCEGLQPTWGAADEQLLDRAADSGDDLVRGNSRMGDHLAVENPAG
jgi:hypothetical protein